VSSLMNDDDQILISHITSSNSMFFDLLSLRVNEIPRFRHMSSLMDDHDGFVTSLMHFPSDPTIIGPRPRSDGSDILLLRALHIVWTWISTVQIFSSA